MPIFNSIKRQGGNIPRKVGEQDRKEHVKGDVVKPVTAMDDWNIILEGIISGKQWRTQTSEAPVQEVIQLEDLYPSSNQPLVKSRGMVELG